MIKQYKNWLYLTGVFLILALPLFTASPWFFPAAWGKTIVFRIILSILIFLFIYQLLFQKTLCKKSAIVSFLHKDKNKVFWPLWLLLALFGIFLLATIFSQDPVYSFFGDPRRAGGFLNFGFYIIFAILCFLILQKQDWQKILDFTILIGVLVSIVAIFQQYNIFSKIIIPYSGRPPSTIGGPTFLALYLLLLVFITLSFLLSEKQGKKKVFYLLALLLFLYIIILTGSRAAYFGLAIGFIYFILCYPKKQRLVVLLKILFVLLLIVGAYGIYYINTHPKLPNYLQENKSAQAVLSRFSINLALENPRFSAWVISLQAVKDRPILGYGVENFSIGFDKYYDPLLPYITKNWGSWYDKAHNFLFDISVTAGIPALIIFISLFTVLFYRLQKLKYSLDNPDTIIAHGIQACFFGYLAANLFSFDVFSTYLILFLIIGYSLSLINPVKLSFEQSKESTPLWKSGSMFILFCILILFIWLINLKPFFINKEINLADYYVRTDQCEKALEKMEKDVLSSQSIIDSYAKLKYIDIIGKCSKKIPGLKLTLAPKAISALKEAGEIRPCHTRIWLFLGTYTNLLIENKDHLKIENVEELKKQAYSYFEKAYQLSPKREELFVSWIYTDLLSEKYQAAKEKAKECINLNPEFAYCWWLKALSNIYLEEIKQAEKNIEIATEKRYNSNSKESLSQLAKAYLKLTEETGELKYYEKLVDLFKKLVIIEPNNYQHHASLAYIYKVLGDYEKAKEQALIVIELFPDSKENVEEFLKTLPNH